MQGPGLALTERGFPEFDRRFFESHEDFTRIGTGSLGGKAAGLARIKRALEEWWRPDEHPAFEIGIPRLTVVATDVFDCFLEENGLRQLLGSSPHDEDVARAFQAAHLPAWIVGDLRGLIERVRQPLAVRSSSLLEDAQDRPLAGVYQTKMLPNNQIDAESRFRRLTEAIKLVWASTYFEGARDYRAATAGADRDAAQAPSNAEEKMAVVIQEVVGRRHGDRFYPDLSGVARSWNVYAASPARPDEGTASLALGLGKTIVDGGVAWCYSPAHPRNPPPFGSTRDLLKHTQTRFWAVNMGPPPPYNPIAETEYLVESGLQEAEQDGVLARLASTYDPASDRLAPGTGSNGSRVLTFAPLLEIEERPVNHAIRAMLALAERSYDGPVEIEFAITFDETREPDARIGFLQARPMLTSEEGGDVRLESLEGPDVLIAAESVMGHGVIRDLCDIVYVKPDRFDPARNPVVARELSWINREILAEGRRYLLIGFGRWGSADPWLGIPARWGQISGARVIVEASLPHAQADPSQGSHFFHNMISLRVLYFTVRHTDPRPIRWDWFATQPAARETELVRHVRLAQPLRVEVDGRRGRGVVRAPSPSASKRAQS